MSEDIFCYVCSKRIKSEGVYCGKGTHRHDSCHPGSDKWLNSSVGKKSAFRESLTKKEKPEQPEVKVKKTEDIKSKLSKMFV